MATMATHSKANCILATMTDIARKATTADIARKATTADIARKATTADIARKATTDQKGRNDCHDNNSHNTIIYVIFTCLKIVVKKYISLLFR